jgi:hypothetical protein
MLRYIHIPDDWSAHQAWTVLDFLEQIEKLIWDTHGEALMEILAPDPEPPGSDDPLEDAGQNDSENPF